MRRALIIAWFLFAAGVCATLAAQNPQQTPPQKSTPVVQQTIPPLQTTPVQIPAPPQTPAAPQAPAAPAHILRVVVLDPAHGGADTGARGPTGAAEKDLVLEFARIAGDALRAQGFQVVMTRLGDTDPSFEDRATVANAQSDAIFISLHIGSSGPAGTVRTYSFPSASTTAPPGATAAGTTQSVNVSAVQSAAPPAGFLLWREAQQLYTQQSRKLGDLLQVELAQKFKGSPEISSSVPVYELRSVAAPAVAVEISNIAADQQQLEAMAPGVADEIARGVAAYKTIYPPGGK